jgi:hypothetical protein
MRGGNRLAGVVDGIRQTAAKAQAILDDVAAGFALCHGIGNARHDRGTHRGRVGDACDRRGLLRSPDAKTDSARER